MISSSEPMKVSNNHYSSSISENGRKKKAHDMTVSFDEKTMENA